MGQEKIPMTKKRTEFLATYGDLDNTEMLREILFAQSLQIEKQERIRYNLSILVWWVVGLPILYFIIMLFFGRLGTLLY